MITNLSKFKRDVSPRLEADLSQGGQGLEHRWDDPIGGDPTPQPDQPAIRTGNCCFRYPGNWIDEIQFWLTVRISDARTSRVKVLLDESPVQSDQPLCYAVVKQCLGHSSGHKVFLAVYLLVIHPHIGDIVSSAYDW